VLVPDQVIPRIDGCTHLQLVEYGEDIEVHGAWAGRLVAA
jgi:hypothetical protein